ncbi:hypothetical protein CPB86DRAFT_101520 [Serendipita vermifera]|nr:hypothetical protein CPB86DRAFT_101520 [Serendipita vermifera]
MSLYENSARRLSQGNTWGASQVPDQARLPNDVLITIIQFVHGKKELYDLCLASRLVREIATPILYLHHFGNSHWAKTFHLYVLLEHPQFEHMVNTLSICLSPVDCKSQGMNDTLSSSCTSCLGLDEKLGTMLVDLRDLKVLRMFCCLCRAAEYSRHQYFARLKTRVLRRVDFVCICGSMEVIRVLESPCMNSVTSWDVRFSRGHSDEDNDFETALVKTRVLPSLQELHYHGTTLDTLLLEHRRISRLRDDSLGDYDKLLNGRGLWKSDSSLTHLSL